MTIAPVGSEEWRAEMVSRLAKEMQAVSRRYRRRHSLTKKQRPGSANSRAVSDRAQSQQRKGFE